MRVYNFSAGPSMLPLPVLERAAKEMTDYAGSGMSVMEMSHRSKVYQSIIDDAQARLRRVMQIPEDYEVLFMQGGASQQFACIPLNLLKTKASYAVTGNFSKKAYDEAKKFGEVHLAADNTDIGFARIPAQDELDIAEGSDYFHICFNNTVYGTKWNYIPSVPCPLVADLSSCILSEPVDVSKFDLIYAGAQKNMAPAGLTVVILKKSLIGHAREGTPTMLDYKTHADNGSMFNTPPTYQIYILKLVLEWIESLGGLEGMAKINSKKAKILYDCLDASSFYIPRAEKESRSIMNVTFRTPTPELDAKFVAESLELGFQNLKGYRAAGGIRASIYNAMPVEGVEALVDFMQRFERENA
ncbi:MAG: 3-phosphoserine/phosphohydroxythreonine transaminase [Oscillospiraceae bacterium]|nr:3-phosphoserine/phosphohydroxythreonine transaminase [Oscillospiraceae bacterium]MBQ3880583.1 3-phosphoserine/phosphohydroxythreonine transaminase [Oscillospiraceae bacterium]